MTHNFICFEFENGHRSLHATLFRGPGKKKMVAEYVVFDVT